jgi:FkbM family methyltransferase
MLKALFYPGDVPFESLFIPAIYHEIYYDGIYVDILNVLDKEKKDPIIVDIGANVGVTVQLFRDHAKKVYAIEPATEHFEAISKNKEFNKWDNVELFKLAISDTNGKDTLSFYQNNRTSHSLVYHINITPGDCEEVETMTVNTFLESNGITHVDFMKMDIEGAEDKVLRSKDFAEASKKIDNIMLEFHYPTFPELINIMIDLGYKARRYPCSAVVVDFSK